MKYTDLFQIDDLRELDQKFLIIPPQVFTAEVSGLQDYEQSDTILNQLNQNLLGKSLAAMVENRACFNKRLTSDSDELPKLIFFDTSTEDVDININQKLIEFIGKLSVHLLQLFEAPSMSSQTLKNANQLNVPRKFIDLMNGFSNLFNTIICSNHSGLYMKRYIYIVVHFSKRKFPQ